MAVPHDSPVVAPGQPAFLATDAELAAEILGHELDSVLHDVVVDQHGAVGDGTTDDTAAIQAAIDEAGTDAWVRFTRNKAYAISSALVIPSGARIDLNGATIRRKAGIIPTALITITSATDIIISNGTVDGNALADLLVAEDAADRFGGIVITTASDIHLQDLEITGVVNNESGSAGIYVLQSTDVHLERIKGHGNDRTAVLFWESSQSGISDSDLYDNEGSGVSSYMSPECYYRNLRAWDNGYSNVSVNGERSLVSDILTHGSLMSGLNIGHDGQPTDDTQVSNVISYGNTLDGITIVGSARVRVVGGAVYGNVRNNIFVTTGSSAAQLLGVTSRDSAGGQGIYLNAGSDHQVLGCAVHGNYAAGIYTTTKARLVGNSIYNNDQGAVGSAGVTVAGAVDCLITGNEIFDDQGVPTQEYGLWISGGSDHRVSNNRMHGNVTQDLRATGSPTGVLYSNNDPSTLDTLPALTTHEAASNPHPTYETSAEAAAKITAHEALTDPHTGYQRESEKGAASGYASLDGSGQVPVAQMLAPVVGKVDRAGVGSNLTATSSAWADMDTTNLSIALTTRARRVLLVLSGRITSDAASRLAGFNFSVDGTPVVAEAAGTVGVLPVMCQNATTSYGFNAMFVTDALSAGAHTFKARWANVSNANTITAHQSGANDHILFTAVELL